MVPKSILRAAVRLITALTLEASLLTPQLRSSRRVLCTFSLKSQQMRVSLFWVTGYHYPTLADLLTQVTAVESSVTDLQVALCELYEEKGGKLMAKIYAALIRKGIKTLDEVPARLRSTVKALLAANGISAVSEQDEETEEPDETERT